MDPGLHPAEWWSPLMYACEVGSLEAVELLVSHGARVNYKSREKFCDPVILIAAANGSKEIVEFLLLKGANQNQFNFEGATALLMAALENHTDCVKMLLRHNSMVRMGEVIFTRFSDTLSSIGLRTGKCSNPEMKDILLAAGCLLPWVTGHREDDEDYEDEEEEDEEEEEEEDDFPDTLKILCKDFIRNLLLEKYWTTNLFCMIPDLPLPTVLKRYLLNNVGFAQEILDERIKK